MKKCKLISTAVATVILGSSAYAGGMDSFLNDAVMTQSSGGRTIKTEQGTMLYGGSFQMKAKTVDIHPFSATAPHVRAGCGGIDIGLGSLSFLNMDQIVSLLQGMMANAPGVMFEMGLKVICPACMDTLNALEQLTNQINGMNLNSCSLDKKMGNYAAGLLEDKVHGGMIDDFNKGLRGFAGNVKSFASDIGDINKFLNDEGCDPTSPNCGATFFMTSNDSLKSPSFMDYAFNKGSSDPFVNGDYVFTMAMRYFAGDIIKNDGAGQGDKKVNGTLTWLPPNINKDAITKGVKPDAIALAILGYLAGDQTAAQAGTPTVTDSKGKPYPISMNSSMKTQIMTQLDGIISAVNNRKALTPEQLSFLSYYQMPIYLIINKLASIPQGGVILTRIEKNLADMMAYETLYEYISRTANIISQQQSKMTPKIMAKIPFDCPTEGGCLVDVSTHLGEMSRSLRLTAIMAYNISMIAADKVSSQIGEETKILENVNKLSLYTLSQSDPGVFEKLMFSKSLTK